MQIHHIPVVAAPSQHTGQPVLGKKKKKKIFCVLKVSGFRVIHKK